MNVNPVLLNLVAAAYFVLELAVIFYVILLATKQL